jgi:NADH dehydrogenase (ubiquinone) 1 alpha subcomplex subunit 5
MKITRTLFNALQRQKLTGITGLAHIDNPRPILLERYRSTLDVLSQMPSSSVYRTATEALTKQRIQIVESTEDINQIEQQIGSGLAEELIHTAQDELSLAQKMLLWKPWEALEDPAPAVSYV